MSSKRHKRHRVKSASKPAPTQPKARDNGKMRMYDVSRNDQKEVEKLLLKDMPLYSLPKHSLIKDWDRIP